MKNNVLIIAPHVDDGELGSGGTIAKLIEQGMSVHYLAFSIEEETIPIGIDKNMMLEEYKRATKILGMDPKNLIIKTFPIPKFNLFKQAILEILIEIRNKVKPDLVFMP